MACQNRRQGFDQDVKPLALDLSSDKEKSRCRAGVSRLAEREFLESNARWYDAEVTLKPLRPDNVSD
jgi:hypothetical protein